MKLFAMQVGVLFTRYSTDDLTSRDGIRVPDKRRVAIEAGFQVLCDNRDELLFKEELSNTIRRQSGVLPLKEQTVFYGCLSAAAGWVPAVRIDCHSIVPPAISNTMPPAKAKIVHDNEIR